MALTFTLVITPRIIILAVDIVKGKRYHDGGHTILTIFQKLLLYQDPPKYVTKFEQSDEGSIYQTKCKFFQEKDTRRLFCKMIPHLRPSHDMAFQNLGEKSRFFRTFYKIRTNQDCGHHDKHSNSNSLRSNVR